VSAAILSHQDHFLPTTAVHPSDPAPRTLGVLVVDDEATVRTLLALCLCSAGFPVWQAAGGREALDLYAARRKDIDLVLLDVRMPGLDGPRTFMALRQLDPEVRCCFMSGDPGAYSVEELLTSGAVGYLSKPFRLAEVEALLRRATRTH
jgi:CheY-like chemotaxis protein